MYAPSATLIEVVWKMVLTQWITEATKASAICEQTRRLLHFWVWTLNKLLIAVSVWNMTYIVPVLEISRSSHNKKTKAVDTKIQFTNKIKAEHSVWDGVAAASLLSTWFFLPPLAYFRPHFTGPCHFAGANQREAHACVEKVLKKL